MYGSAHLRTYYGAGDYQRLAAVQGYYTAGGFFSSLGKLARKVAAPVAKVVSNPLVGGALSFVPGGGLIAKGVGIAGKLLSSPLGRAASTALTVSGGISAAKGAYSGLRSLAASPAARGLAAGAAIGVGQEAVRSTRRRKKRGRRKVTVEIVAKKGARKVKRRRKSQSGRRVSFRTKDGRTVSFTRK